MSISELIEAYSIGDISQCSCCGGCLSCDYNITDITVSVSGSYDYTANYWAGNVGIPVGEYWDAANSYFSYNISATFSQVARDGGTLVKGEYTWYNGKYFGTFSEECKCDYVGMNFYDYMGGTLHPYHAYSTDTMTTLITDRDDTDYIITDGTASVETGFRFGNPEFFYDETKGLWTMRGNVQGAVFMGDNAGDFEIDCDKGVAKCGHPNGVYTAAIDDSFSGTGDECDDFVPRTNQDRINNMAPWGSDAETWVEITSTINVTVTIGGSGTTNCEDAPEVDDSPS